MVVYGLPTIRRAVLAEKEGKGFKIFAEGTGLAGILRMRDVDFRQTRTNNIKETLDVLGVEAARQVIINQTKETIGIYGIVVDYRHISLLADVITYNGYLVGLNRYGIVKMKNSPMMLASFETTGEVLFDAAFFGLTDQMKGVSEKVLIGDNINLGTGKFDLLDEGVPPPAAQ